MSLRIEDYALIGNTYSAALVGRNGSIDWLCVPRFDSPACFAALLGTRENGRWLIASEQEPAKTRRHYRGDTLVLETEFVLPGGDTAAVIDFMPIMEHGGRVDLFRLVEGRRGRVPMRMELVVRFDYGHVVPWVRQLSGHQGPGVTAVAGPEPTPYNYTPRVAPKPAAPAGAAPPAPAIGPNAKGPVPLKKP